MPEREWITPTQSNSLQLNWSSKATIVTVQAVREICYE
jgi:hypothetical protein